MPSREEEWTRRNYVSFCFLPSLSYIVNLLVHSISSRSVSSIDGAVSFCTTHSEMSQSGGWLISIFHLVTQTVGQMDTSRESRLSSFLLSGGFALQARDSCSMTCVSGSSSLVIVHLVVVGMRGRVFWLATRILEGGSEMASDLLHCLFQTPFFAEGQYGYDFLQ